MNHAEISHLFWVKIFELFGLTFLWGTVPYWNFTSILCQDFRVVGIDFYLRTESCWNFTSILSQDLRVVGTNFSLRDCILLRSLSMIVCISSMRTLRSSINDSVCSLAASVCSFIWDCKASICSIRISASAWWSALFVASEGTAFGLALYGRCLAIWK